MENKKDQLRASRCPLVDTECDFADSHLGSALTKTAVA